MRKFSDLLNNVVSNVASKAKEYSNVLTKSNVFSGQVKQPVDNTDVKSASQEDALQQTLHQFSQNQ